jgi:hypothetical protein
VLQIETETQILSGNSLDFDKSGGDAEQCVVQLLVALGLKRAGLVSVFVAADQKLCRVAMIESFTTLNPEQPLKP